MARWRGKAQVEPSIQESKRLIYYNINLIKLVRNKTKTATNASVIKQKMFGSITLKY